LVLKTLYEIDLSEKSLSIKNELGGRACHYSEPIKKGQRSFYLVLQLYYYF
jgi:hypothetical protein